MILSKSLGALSVTAIVAAALAAWFGATVASADGRLRGLKGVRVEVFVSEEVEQGGLAAATLKAQVEQALREAGLYVPTAGQWNTPSAHQPLLFVSVVGQRLSSAEGVYVFSATLQLRELVRPWRNANQQFTAVTWQPPTPFGTVGEIHVSDLAQPAQHLVEEFVRAYRLANPSF